MTLTHCDKCGGLIKDGKCPCGDWYDYKDQPREIKIFEKAIETFGFLRDQKKAGFIMSMDHHSGVCMILFEGDYHECMKAVSFIENLKKEKP